MARGILKTIGAAKRLRFVKEGYDANDLGVHPNNVIFDSSDEGTLNLLATGTYVFGGGNTGGGTSPVQFVSWSMPYVPLCMFQFSFNGSTWNQVLGTAAFNIGPQHYVLEVSTSGIRMCADWNLISQPLWVRYFAFRLAV